MMLNVDVPGGGGDRSGEVDVFNGDLLKLELRFFRFYGEDDDEDNG
ncbi:hypothetical protein HanRHA438_Chr11g0498871 [Helianthus annuus]|nr:hypothetical protein HanIR_Chr11g0523351 [Helianthus annuus]KAJ0870303.1 hypothetical protein HanRHA438_Chr11g0498871 [Helianthus annuus]